MVNGKYLKIRDRLFSWGSRTYLQAIINVTPDSFAGDGLGTDLPKITAQALAFEAAGADILDIGGASSRPGATPVDLAEETRRVLSAIHAVRPLTNLPISVDTNNPQVAEAALAAGADIINDIGGLSNPQMLELAVKTAVPVILMHMRGTPQTMHQFTDYAPEVVAALLDFFRQQIAVVTEAGVKPSALILDPGIGFAKTGDQNIALIKRLPELRQLGYPLLLGVSRKKFIGTLVAKQNEPPVPPAERVYGTVAAIALAVANGADIVRVHDVAAVAGALRVIDRIVRAD